ncbi:MAG TPA: class 1 fructose-bisphosphatase [Gammaproteobacteria bacterium]|nr:class 1 fructose-bisphosphatase [Gammaproteobacteria bacterium]
MRTPSLHEYLQGRVQAGLDAGLARLLEAIAASCVRIAAGVQRGALDGVLGGAGAENVQGEAQKKLDVLSNQWLLDGTAGSGELGGIASEEMDGVHPVAEGSPLGRWLLLFDPLDGSSNIDVNVTIGTIFSLLPHPRPGMPAIEADFLQAGHHQAAAGYVAYGPQVQLVLTTGGGVDGFTLDPSSGQFLLTAPAITLPADTREFSINTSNARFWEPPVARYIQECVAGKAGPRGENFNMRWVGSMVADVHRTLGRGGVFMYPRDTRDLTKPGKLRLMYEANPMGWLVEQAGGRASTGRERILDIAPAGLHQRVAVIMGSRNEVELLDAYHAETPA